MTTTMEREPADFQNGADGGAADANCGAAGVGCDGVAGAGCGGASVNDDAPGACDASEGCGVDKNFSRRKQQTTNGSATEVDNNEVGRERRRRVVKNAKVVIVIGMTLAWLSELGGDVVNLHDRSLRREFIGDSMMLDLQTGGTAIGVYPSSRSDILSRWSGVAQSDERKWRNEDNVRAFNWLMLLALSAGAWYLFRAQKGKQIVADYIENGVPEQSIKWL